MSSFISQIANQKKEGCSPSTKVHNSFSCIIFLFKQDHTKQGPFTSTLQHSFYSTSNLIQVKLALALYTYYFPTSLQSIKLFFQLLHIITARISFEFFVNLCAPLRTRFPLLLLSYLSYFGTFIHLILILFKVLSLPSLLYYHPRSPHLYQKYNWFILKVARSVSHLIVIFG